MTSARGPLAIGALLLTACTRTTSLPDLAPISNTTSGVSFASIVNGGPAVEARAVDMRTLGPRIDAYLVERFGVWTSEAQQVELLLVLVSGDTTIRIALTDPGSIGRSHEPFGTLRVARACAQDAHRHACEEQPQPLLGMTAHDADTAADWRLLVEPGGLVVRNPWGEQRIVIADDAQVFAPAPMIEAPILGKPVVVSVHESREEQANTRYYDLSLQIGDRLGHVSAELADLPELQSWEVPAIPAALPLPLPDADLYLTHRLYLSDIGSTAMLLGHVGDELVGWRRSFGPSVVDHGWEEMLRLPVPAGSEIVVR